MGNLETLCEFICSIIFPPFGVFAHRGCGIDLLINILLTILGYFPGMFVTSSTANTVFKLEIFLTLGVIHAILIICCTPQVEIVREQPVVVVVQKETV